MVGMVLGGCSGTKTEGGVTSGVQKSLRELIDGKQSQKCTVKVESGEGEVTSEMWTKNGKFKQISKTKGLSEEMEDLTIYTISDGEWIYSWNDKSDKGMKFSVRESEEMADNVPEEMKGSAVDWDEKIDFDCKATSVADSEFVPPTNIEFTNWMKEMTKMQETATQQMEESGTNNEAIQEMMEKFEEINGKMEE